MLKISLAAFYAILALGLSEASAARISANRFAPKLPAAGAQAGSALKPSLPNYSYENLNRLLSGKISKPLPVLGSENSLLELIAVMSPSKDEVRKLREAAARGDSEAQFYGNLGLVMSVAKKHSHQMEYADLVQEGLKGLLKAMEKFDPKRGFKFSTYAEYWIEQHMRRAVDDTGHTIRIPPHARQDISRVLKVAQKYRQMGQAPALEDYIRELKIKPKKAKRLVEAMQLQQLASLDVTVDEDEETGLKDIIPDSSEDPAKGTEESKVREDVEKALASLSEREAEIIRLRFGLGTGEEKTLEEVGKKFTITRERVRQIEAAALKKLLRGKSLHGYR